MNRLALLLPLALTACNGDLPSTAKQEELTRFKSGQVALVAVAPDGTKLWAVRGYRTIYFSSGGTQTSHPESCGKSCWHEVDDEVPAAHSY